MLTDYDIKVELVTSEELFKAAMAVRRQVFVKELGIPERKEFDGNDFCSAHVVAYIQKRHRKLPIGTLRIRFFSDFAKIERAAVTRNFRKTSVSEDMMQYGFNYIAQKGYHKIYAMCKKELLPRWQRCGYREIDGANRVEQNGMTLAPICCNLPENAQALTMQSSPSLLNAKEGHWYDAPQKENNPSRIDNVLLKLKRLKQEYL